MPRTDIIKDILNTNPKPPVIKRVNDRAKRFVNKLIGKDIFDLEPVRSEALELHKDYLAIFDIEQDQVKRVVYDLAEHSGFFRAHRSGQPQVDAYEEGKRALFIYILGKITKEPLTMKGKE